MLLRTKPFTKYSGLTMILSHPGRFDTPQDGPQNLCSGPAGRLIEDALSPTPIGRFGVDFRTAFCQEPLLEGTKVVLLMGERAAALQGVPVEKFKAWRGAPIERNGLIYIPTFHPQDACDKYVAYEDATIRRFYKDAAGEVKEEERKSDEDVEDEVSSKEYGKTARGNFYFWTKFDIRKSVRLLQTKLSVPTTKYHILYSPKDGTSILKSIPEGLPLYLDLETDPLSGRIICIGFSTSLSDTYSVAIQPRMYGSVENPSEICEFLRQLVLLFDRCSQIIIHNAQFDLFILAWLYRLPIPKQAKIYDTMVSHHRLYGGVEKSLGHCISLYTDLPYHKDEAIFTPNNHAQLTQLLTYNAKDVFTMALVHLEQLHQASQIEGLLPSVKQANSILRPLLLKAIRGMRIDSARLCSTIDDYRARATIIEEQIVPRLSGLAKLNVRSPIQVAKLLYDDWGLSKPIGKNVSLTGKETIFKVAIKYPLPTLKAIVKARMDHHSASQLSFKLWREDRVTSHLEATTDSYRLRSRKLFAKWGTNVQNWAKKLRRVVVAPPGCKLIQADQKNAEALIVAYLVKANTRYRRLLLSGTKLHTYVALHLFKSVWDQLMQEDCERFLRCEVEDLKKQPRFAELDKHIRASDNNEPSSRWYYMAKQTGLSANYGVGASEFSKNTLEKSEGQVFIPIPQAERFLSIYRNELFPEIVTQFQDYVRSCAAEGTLRNMFGFPRRLFDHPSARQEERYLKACYAWIAQSTVGTITNIADSEIQEGLDEGQYRGFEVWTNTHDSLLACASEEDTLSVAQILQKHLGQWLTNPWGEKFQMQSDVSVGDNWYEVKELK